MSLSLPLVITSLWAAVIILTAGGAAAQQGNPCQEQYKKETEQMQRLEPAETIGTATMEAGMGRCACASGPSATVRRAMPS